MPFVPPKRIRSALPGVLGLLLLLHAAAAEARGGAERVYTHSLDTHDQFTRFSVPINGTPFTKFVIDAKSGQPFYFWTAVYPFHYHFVNEVLMRMSGTPYKDIHEFNQRNHSSDDRDFLLGSIAFHPTHKIFTFEFLEVDRPSPAVIQRSHEVLLKSFFDKGILWRPVGKRQVAMANTVAGVPTIKPGMLDPGGIFQYLNRGTSVGRLRVVRPGQDASKLDFARDEIVLLYEVPMDIVPVAGVISIQFSTPLSHVNLRARAWGIPNMSLRNALVRTRGLDGKWVLLDVHPEGFELRGASQAEIARAKRLAKTAKSEVRMPRADLKRRGLPRLKDLGRPDALSVGAKAANQGVMMQQRTAHYEVPPAFSIPFGHYVDFMKANKLDGRVRALLRSKVIRKDRPARRKALAELRQAILDGKHIPAFRKELLATTGAPPFKGRGLFVRSSTNAEDLEGFNGAGLYDTVPNVKGDEAQLQAVKRVWSSLWNDRAWEERDFYRIDHSACYPGVLVQVGVNATAAGVLITKSIYDAEDTSVYTINAKHGLGLRVVDGKRVPEQVLFAPKTGEMRIISRSDDTVATVFDEKGGVKEVKASGKAVLTHDTAAALAAAAADVAAIFRDTGAQDIEWLIADGKVQLVQSRPYVEPGASDSP
jgi:hypothetical protein